MLGGAPTGLGNVNTGGQPDSAVQSPVLAPLGWYEQMEAIFAAKTGMLPLQYVMETAEDFTSSDNVPAADIHLAGAGAAAAFGDAFSSMLHLRSSNAGVAGGAEWFPANVGAAETIADTVFQRWMVAFRVFYLSPLAGLFFRLGLRISNGAHFAAIGVVNLSLANYQYVEDAANQTDTGVPRVGFTTLYLANFDFQQVVANINVPEGVDVPVRIVSAMPKGPARIYAGVTQTAAIAAGDMYIDRAVLLRETV